jgi:hypothetical protein
VEWKVVSWYRAGMLSLGGDWYATWWLAGAWYAGATGAGCAGAAGAAEGPAYDEGENKKLAGGS